MPTWTLPPLTKLAPPANYLDPSADESLHLSPGSVVSAGDYRLRRNTCPGRMTQQMLPRILHLLGPDRGEHSMLLPCHPEAHLPVPTSHHLPYAAHQLKVERDCEHCRRSPVLVDFPKGASDAYFHSLSKPSSLPPTRSPNIVPKLTTGISKPTSHTTYQTPTFQRNGTPRPADQVARPHSSPSSLPDPPWRYAPPAYALSWLRMNPLKFSCSTSRFS